MPATPRLTRVASSLCLMLPLVSCGGDGPTGPGAGKSSIRALLGANVTDTVDTQPLQALVVEVRGLEGTLASGVVVRFEPQPSADTTRQYEPALFACALSAQYCGYGGLVADTTDAQGRAKVTVKLGHVAGRAVMRLVVPEFGLEDSVAYTVKPGLATDVRAAVPDTALNIGEVATLKGHVVDRYENARPEQTSVSAGPGTAITLNTATGAVTARDIGMQWVITRYSSFADSTRVRVVPSGRLVVWSSYERLVRLVNLNGTAERTIVSDVASDFGVFPQFSPTRQTITLQAGTEFYGGPSSKVIVIDTTGNPRRDIGTAAGFSTIVSTRELADGNLLVVASRSSDTSHPGYSLWRVATDNAVTFLAALPEMTGTYGGADISHSGSKVAFIATQSYTLELRVLNLATGVITPVEVNARSPRWSSQDDRLAYLVPGSSSYQYDGTLVVSNSDGTGRRAFGTTSYSPGLTWSPDAKYIVGRSTDYSGLRLVRVSDAVEVVLPFSSPTGCCRDYYQPDWR